MVFFMIDINNQVRVARMKAGRPESGTLFEQVPRIPLHSIRATWELQAVQDEMNYADF
jgi:hypothetical protein